MKKLLSRVTSALLIIALMVLINPNMFTIKAQAADLVTYAPVFNATYYAAHNSDVASMYGNNVNALFDHFINYGMNEGRQASEEFNVQAYKNRYGDLRAAFGNNLKSYYIHYIQYGKAEGRNARPDVVQPATNPSPAAQTANASSGEYSGNAQIYYDKAVFVGDSIMVGYRNYSANPTSVTNRADFLCNVSYSLYNAFTPGSSLHPVYAGQKRYVWDSIAMMDVDKVFIMWGTNDLVCFAPDAIIPKYQQFIANIQAAKPGIQINIISMTPVYAGTNKGSLNNPSIDMLNALLLQMCQQNGYGYVDLNTPLKDATGNMNPIYSSDRYVHHNNAAYSGVWEAVLNNYAASH